MITNYTVWRHKEGRERFTTGCLCKDGEFRPFPNGFSMDTGEYIDHTRRFWTEVSANRWIAANKEPGWVYSVINN